MISEKFIFLLLLLIGIAEPPEIIFQDMPLENQSYFREVINQIPKERLQGIQEIQIFGKEVFPEDAWYYENGTILIDKSGLREFNVSLYHELIHNKCGLEHNTSCFRQGFK